MTLLVPLLKAEAVKISPTHSETLPQKTNKIIKIKLNLITVTTEMLCANIFTYIIYTQL